MGSLQTLDIGLDYSLFKGRIQGSIDWYHTKTSDILLQRSLPYTSGYEDILQNIGATSSKGIEFNVGANIIDNPEGFRWNLAFNIAGYKEKITELALRDENGNPVDDVGNQWFIGKPINVFYDYRKTGFIRQTKQTWPMRPKEKYRARSNWKTLTATVLLPRRPGHPRFGCPRFLRRYHQQLRLQRH